jgi:hypothetical protein
MEEKIKYKHEPTGIIVTKYNSAIYIDACSTSYQAKIVENGQDWQRVEEPKRIEIELVCIGSDDRQAIFKKSHEDFTSKELTAIESLLNEEKESIWSDEEIEAIKKWCNDGYFTSPSFMEFLDSKKGEKKQC